MDGFGEKNKGRSSIKTTTTQNLASSFLARKNKTPTNHVNGCTGYDIKIEEEREDPPRKLLLLTTTQDTTILALDEGRFTHTENNEDPGSQASKKAGGLISSR